MRTAIISLSIFCLVGCGSRSPRSRDEIFREKGTLPRLYLTKKSHTRVLGPASKGIFTDDKTGEECWPAMECINPDCPAAGSAEPFLFTTFDRSEHNGCPACAKIRNVKTETPQQKRAYIGYVQLYELPETKSRSKQLDDELKRNFDAKGK